MLAVVRTNYIGLQRAEIVRVALESPLNNYASLKPEYGRSIAQRTHSANKKGQPRLLLPAHRQRLGARAGKHAAGTPCHQPASFPLAHFLVLYVLHFGLGGFLVQHRSR